MNAGDKGVIDLNLVDTKSVQDISVQDWWDVLVDEGVDPDEEHIAVTDVYVEDDEAIVQELARGNLMECLIAASKVDTFVRVLPLERYYEVSGGLN